MQTSKLHPLSLPVSGRQASSPTWLRRAGSPGYHTRPCPPRSNQDPRGSCRPSAACQIAKNYRTPRSSSAKPSVATGFPSRHDCPGMETHILPVRLDSPTIFQRRRVAGSTDCPMSRGIPTGPGTSGRCRSRGWRWRGSG